jgi:hypothetical protein
MNWQKALSYRASVTHLLATGQGHRKGGPELMPLARLLGRRLRGVAAAVLLPTGRRR